MKKIFAIAAAAIVSLASVAPAMAWELDWKAGAGGTLGGTGNFTQSKNFSEGAVFGTGAKNFADGEAYGLSESTFEGKYSGGNGMSPVTSFKGTTLVGSGSRSNVSTELKGNGSAYAGNTGYGVGAGVSLGGVGALTGKK